MTLRSILVKPCVGLSLAIICAATATAGEITDPPRVFQCSGAALAAARERAMAGDPKISGVVEQLRDRGNSLLNDGPFSIVDKKHPLPGVDPHDYVSLAPYYWPNPNTPDGVPYIRRDGVRNPETIGYDAKVFSAFSEHVWGLALSGYITGDGRYSRRAALLVRAWFFDPATRMNPNLDHAQFVKGENLGRGTGVLDSVRFLNVLDGVGLLQKSSDWSADDQAKLEDWFRTYLKWLRESPNGLAESRATNNHSNWYDVQETAFMLFLGDEAGARQVLEEAKTKRIAKQIEPDGRAPRELSRTKSWGYSCYNLKALTLLADLGERVDIDLWNFQTPDGRSIRAALDFLLPYATGQQQWPHQQISRFDPNELLLPLRRAAIALKNPKYAEAVTQLQAGADADNVNSLGFRVPDSAR